MTLHANPWDDWGHVIEFGEPEWPEEVAAFLAAGDPTPDRLIALLKATYARGLREADVELYDLLENIHDNPRISWIFLDFDRLTERISKRLKALAPIPRRARKKKQTTAKPTTGDEEGQP